jgi:hypothetical protein
MGKFVFALTVALVLGFAGTALAKTVFFHGKGTDDPKVKIDFDVHGPKDKRSGGIRLEDALVQDFSITGATQTITCEGVPTDLGVSYFFEDEIQVSEDGDFSHSEKVKGAGTQTAKVKGQVDNGSFVDGWFRLNGTAGGCKVDTGRINWKANDFG